MQVFSLIHFQFAVCPSVREAIHTRFFNTYSILTTVELVRNGIFSCKYALRIVYHEASLLVADYIPEFGLP